MSISIKKLPDMEFALMKAVWDMPQPASAPLVTERVRKDVPEKEWKPQTVMTGLVRLEKKGFLYSEKKGKERSYYTVITQEQYLQVEAKNFRHRFSGGRFAGLVKALCDTEELSEEDIKELRSWLDSKEES